MFGTIGYGVLINALMVSMHANRNSRWQVGNRLGEHELEKIYLFVV